MADTWYVDATRSKVDLTAAVTGTSLRSAGIAQVTIYQLREAGGIDESRALWARAGDDVSWAKLRNALGEQPAGALPPYVAPPVPNYGSINGASSGGGAGAPGPAGPAGQGFTFRGAWQAVTAYAAYDVVTNQGQSYLCTAAHTSGVAFTLSGWAVLAAKGTDGQAGQAGAVGAAGPQGPSTVVTHGTVAGTARPTVTAGTAVLWVGAATPANAATGDLWYDPTADVWKRRTSTTWSVSGSSTFLQATTGGPRQVFNVLTTADAQALVSSGAAKPNDWIGSLS